MAEAFPAKMPLEKPTDRELSAAMVRMYDVWNPHEDVGNEFFSNFKYSRLKGFSREPNVSRRDPSKVPRIDGKYYVWYATSGDGFTWEEQGPTVKRPPKGEFGWRSNCTPDILVWKGRYYLYHQAYSAVIQGAILVW